MINVFGASSLQIEKSATGNLNLNWHTQILPQFLYQQCKKQLKDGAEKSMHFKWAFEFSHLKISGNKSMIYGVSVNL